MYDLILEQVSAYLFIILDWLEKKGINQPLLFNTEGNKAKIEVLINKIRNFTPLSQFKEEIYSEKFYSQFDLAWSIHSILSQLNHPLILENYNEAYIVNTYYEDIEKIKSCILELPDINIQVTLKLFSVFKKLCSQEYHRSFIILSPETLGELFSNVLMRFKKEKDEAQQFGNKMFGTNVIACLIINYNEIFDSTILEFEHREQKSRENAQLFMDYVSKKYTSLDNHFRDIYNKYIPHKRNLTQEEAKTIKTEFNLRKFSGGKTKVRPPIPIYM